MGPHTNTHTMWNNNNGHLVTGSHTHTMNNTHTHTHAVCGEERQGEAGVRWQVQAETIVVVVCVAHTRPHNHWGKKVCGVCENVVRCEIPPNVVGVVVKCGQSQLWWW